MRRWISLVLTLVSGCAQIFGIEQTTGAPVQSDAAVDTPGIDTQTCFGGDARVIDPTYGHCYTLFLTAKTYAAARADCDLQGVHLARIANATENDIVSTLIGANGVAFLAGNDLGAEGTFLWDDGTVPVFTNWNTGEPNNGGGLYEEDCMVMTGVTGGRWDDRPCAPETNTVDGEYAYVCEHD